MSDTNYNNIIFEYIKSTYKCNCNLYAYNNYGITFMLDKENYLQNNKNYFSSITNFNILNNYKYEINKPTSYIKKNINLIKILNNLLSKNNEYWTWKIDCSTIKTFKNLSKLIIILNQLHNEHYLNNCQNIYLINLNKIYKYYIFLKLFKTSLINLIMFNIN